MILVTGYNDDVSGGDNGGDNINVDGVGGVDDDGGDGDTDRDDIGDNGHDSGNNNGDGSGNIVGDDGDDSGVGVDNQWWQCDVGGGIGGDDDSNIGDNECADSDNSSGSDNKRCHDQIWKIYTFLKLNQI